MHRSGFHGIVVAVLVACGSSIRGSEPVPRVDCYGDSLPTGAVARLGTLRLRHDRQPELFIFSPDCRFLASGHPQTPLRIWETATGKEIMTLNVSAIRHLRATFSSDGRFIVVATEDKLTVWNLVTGLIHVCFEKGEATPIDQVCLSPDGRALGLVRGGEVEIREVASGRSRLTFKSDPAKKRCIRVVAL